MKRKAKFDIQCLLSLIGFVLFALCFLLFCLSSKFSNEGEKTENLIFLIFSLLGMGATLASFLDCLFRKNVTHILIIFIQGLLLVAFEVVEAINLHSSNTSGWVFYAIAAALSVIMVYFYIKKALDGDATLGYKIVLILLAVFSFFGPSFGYPALEAYSHQGDTTFWTGCLIGYSYVMLLAISASLSMNNDYQPEERELDEFGNEVESEEAKKAKENLSSK